MAAANPTSNLRHHLAVGLTVLAILSALFYNGQDLVLYALAGTALLASFVLASCLPGRTVLMEFGPLGLVLLALVAWTALSIGWSVVPYLTMLELGVTGAALLAYLAWRPLLKTGHAERFAAVMFTLLGMGLSIVMLAQIALGLEPLATFLNPNSAAGFVNLLWPIPATLIYFTPDRPRVTSGLVAALATMIFAANINGGRAATIACVVMLVILIGTGIFALGRRRRALLLGCVAIGAMLGAQAANLAGFGGRAGGLAGRLATLADPVHAGATRWPIWQSAWEMVGARPWLGFGPGTFFQAYPAYRAPHDVSSGIFVHNDYLQFWVERGLPGVAFLLVLVLACILLFIRHLRVSNQVSRASILIAGTALAGAAVHAVFSYNLHVLPFVIVLGVALATLDDPGPEHARRIVPRAGIGSSRAAAIAAGGACILVATHFWLVAAAYRYTMSAHQHLTTDALASARTEFGLAQRLWGAPDLHWSGHADVYRRSLEILPDAMTGIRVAAKQRGLNLADEARQRNPFRTSTLAILGELHLQSPDPDPESARRSFHAALRHDPRAIRARLSFARMLEEREGIDAANSVIAEGLAAYPGRPPIPLLRYAIKLRRGIGDVDGAALLRERLRYRITSR